MNKLTAIQLIPLSLTWVISNALGILSIRIEWAYATPFTVFKCRQMDGNRER